jgi:hypothetical protein
MTGTTVMADREAALRSLVVGDIFHARSPNGASLVCLLTALNEATIFARRIHTQDDLRFDRKTGVELGAVKSRIDCIAPFPPDIHEIFLDMDRKYRQFRELSKTGSEPDLEQYKLTEAELRALLFIEEHISSDPI